MVRGLKVLGSNLLRSQFDLTTGTVVLPLLNLLPSLGLLNLREEDRRKEARGNFNLHDKC